MESDGSILTNFYNIPENLFNLKTQFSDLNMGYQIAVSPKYLEKR